MKIGQYVKFYDNDNLKIGKISSDRDSSLLIVVDKEQQLYFIVENQLTLLTDEELTFAMLEYL